MSEEISSLISQPQEDEFVFNIFDWGDYRISYFIQKNRSKSANNEDCLFFDLNDESMLLGVCDGVGGSPMGKEAAFNASETIINAHKNKETDFIRVLDRANKSVRDLKVGAATTTCFALIENHQARYFSVGDSEVMHCNGRASEIYTNVPHSPVGYGVEGGFIEQEDSLDSPIRNIVSSLLGSEDIRFEASSIMEVKKGHSILIGSDGIFDNYTHDELFDLINNGVFDDTAYELRDSVVKLQQTDKWRKDDDICYIFMRRLRA